MLKNVFLIGLLFSVISYSGCVEKQTEIRYIQVTPQETLKPEISYVIPEPTSNPIIQTVSGINQVIDISGETIIVSGVSNQVRILNADVSKIVLSGTDNLIYYPKEANPKIVNSGLRNEIKKY